MSIYPVWLDPADSNYEFPYAENALTEPNGLLAIGGDLSPGRIVNAYLQGIFPWYSPDQPILWWSPDPRAVLFPEKFKCSSSLQKLIRKKQFTVTIDEDFESVIQYCAKTPRKDQNGTWITDEMQQAYIKLHQADIAHSVECWLDNQLVGGLYGLGLGNVFFGESMFSHKNNASKVAFAYLVDELQKSNYALIDCQVTSEHLLSLGAEEIPRKRFLELIRQHTPGRMGQQSWLDQPKDRSQNNLDN
jgi:leucyl/phenylalanyl-tRNA--protein transferase